MFCLVLRVGVVPVAVVGNEGRCVASVVDDLGARLLGELLDELVDLGDGGDVLEGHEVGGETGNVGRGCGL